MTEQRLDVRQLIQRPNLDRPVTGSRVELVRAAAEGESRDGITVLGEDAQGLKGRGVLNHDAPIAATRGDELAVLGGGDAENGADVALVGVVLGLVLVALCDGDALGPSFWGWWGLL